MDRVYIICDSPSDVRPSYIEDLDVTVVSATVTYDGRDHMEYPDLEPAEYWDTLERLDYVPQTSQAKLLDYADAMRKARDAGFTHIIVIPVSTTGAGSMQNAKLAADLIKEEDAEGLPVMEFIDSRGYAFMYGHVVITCARMAKSGCSFDEITAYAKNRISRYEALFMVYSLKQMRKSGRIKGFQAFAGEAMGIRPILLCCDGVIDPVDKVRGDKKLLPRMLEILKERIVNPAEQEIVIVYAKVPQEDIDACEHALRNQIGATKILRYPIGACVTTNTGPHCLAVIYEGKKR
jgi:DegV family protein with EDD domain